MLVSKKISLLLLITLFIINLPSVLAEASSQSPDAVATQEDASAYDERLDEAEKASDNQYAVNLFNPNYIFPFYYTEQPDRQVYGDTTPDHQQVMRQELLGQFSFQVPVVKNLFSKDSSLDIAYTQLMVWQVYATSQYFRETDYMPEIFITERYNSNWIGRYSLNHQSNGRGGDMERSWNRAYAETIYSGENWMISVKPWIVIFAHESTTIHNPDIVQYMGHGEITAAIKTHSDLEFSVMTRNNVESHFSRGAEELNFSFPMHGHFRGYIRLFSGYGQTLIEYNHYTNAAGIGVTLNDII